MHNIGIIGVGMIAHMHAKAIGDIKKRSSCSMFRYQ